MMYVLAKLFSNDDKAADSILLTVYVGVVGLLGLAFYQTIWHGVQIGIGEAGTGLAAVIAAGGAVRVGRDRLCQDRPRDDHDDQH